ncbi:MAG: hypothetical protein COW12_01840, partial [Candidatus Omnitrophica bacterium CG12_big_fil_rev_8_21_14_0_65_45_16]
MMNIYAGGAFAVTIFNFTLWFLAFFKRSLSRLAKAFFWWSFFIALWAFGYGMTLGGFLDYEPTLIWNKFCQAMAALIGPFFFRYACTVVERDRENQTYFLIYLITGIVIAFFLFLTDYFVKGLWSFDIYHYQPLGGPLYSVFTVFFFWCTIHGFIVAISQFNQTEGQKRNQLWIFLLATAIPYFGGSTLFLQAYHIPLPSYGVFLILAYVIMTGYGIHKYQFLDLPSLLRTKEVLSLHREKLALIGLMTSAINHEIRNPLFLVQELTQKARDRLTQSHADPYALQALEKASAHIFRMNELVERLRHFGKPAEGQEKQEVDLQEVINNALFFTEQELKYQKVEIEKDFPANLPKVLGNKGQLEEIFLNLFMNALQAMPKGGVLSIVLRTSNIVHREKGNRSTK